MTSLKQMKAIDKTCLTPDVVSPSLNSKMFHETLLLGHPVCRSCNNYYLVYCDCLILLGKHVLHWHCKQKIALHIVSCYAKYCNHNTGIQGVPKTEKKIRGDFLFHNFLSTLYFLHSVICLIITHLLILIFLLHSIAIAIGRK